MKRYILILIIIFELVTIKIPKYIELNNIAIIENITIFKETNNYKIKVKEIIPIKASDGIIYKYKEYKSSANTIEKCLNNIEKKSKKKLYLKRIKLLKTNIYNIKYYFKNLNIKAKKISYIK